MNDDDDDDDDDDDGDDDDDDDDRAYCNTSKVLISGWPPSRTPHRIPRCGLKHTQCTGDHS